ncbi:MAG: hypothetical protein HOD90_01590 [Nitrospina sp.]|nr:hypothetical protein [Nitrospina sp.]MBT3981703.1 hypothetical protein [Bacteriovoracaceae bacterium]MBT4258585.1 hypothetical protein [Nitrospina sp.]MBT4621579.1 hypothetical protein [Nitrospina sp.]
MSLKIGKTIYPIPANRSLVTGDEIAYWENVGGKFKVVEGEIVHDYYREEGGNHVFKILLIACDGTNAGEVFDEANETGGIITRIAKHVYPFGVHRMEWRDENNRRQLEREKNLRSKLAKDFVLMQMMRQTHRAA